MYNIYTYICLKCAQFLKIIAGNSLSDGIQGDATRWIQNLLAGRHQMGCINQSYSN